MILEFRRDGIVEESEEVAVLFLAGGDGGSHAFVVALTFLASCALSDFAVDHAVADLLLAARPASSGTESFLGRTREVRHLATADFFS